MPPQTPIITIHRDEHQLPEHVEQEQVERRRTRRSSPPCRSRSAKQQSLMRVLIEPNDDVGRDRRDERREEDEPEADAVDRHVVADAEATASTRARTGSASPGSWARAAARATRAGREPSTTSVKPRRNPGDCRGKKSTATAPTRGRTTIRLSRCGHSAGRLRLRPQPAASLGPRPTTRASRQRAADDPTAQPFATSERRGRAPTHPDQRAQSRRPELERRSLPSGLMAASARQHRVAAWPSRSSPRRCALALDAVLLGTRDSSNVRSRR